MRKCFTASSIVLGAIFLAGSSSFATEQAAQPAVQAATSASVPKDAVASEKGAAHKTESSEEPVIRLRAPLFSEEFGKTPVAQVNGETITMDDLRNSLASMHDGMMERKTSARMNYAEVLERLINIKLMTQESNNIGLDQLPEVKQALVEFEKSAQRELLLKERLKGLKVDEKQVEERFRMLAKEYKLLSIRFAKEPDAKQMLQDLAAGRKFEELVEEKVKAGLAQGTKEPFYQQASKQLPQVAQALEKTKPGTVTGIIPVDQGFAIMKVEEVNYPENPEARDQAHQDVYNAMRQVELGKFRDELFNKHGKIDRKLLKKLDFEAPKPGFAALAKDKRPLVVIKGEAPVTVADLARAIQEKYFHGVALAIREKKINSAKGDLLNQILYKRVFTKEAQLRGIDKSQEYLKLLADYRETVTFGIFIENVVKPEVKLTDAEAKKYYEEHKADYGAPAMLRMNGIGFTTMEAAQANAEKLRQGVDFKWLRNTADKQVKQDDPEALTFDSEPVAVTTLPAEMANVLTGARTGDVRVYPDGKGRHYAIQVVDSIPPQAAPYREVRDGILRKLYDAKMKDVVAEWTGKLREASKVTVYADFDDKR